MKLRNLAGSFAGEQYFNNEIFMFDLVVNCDKIIVYD